MQHRQYTTNKTQILSKYEEKENNPHISKSTSSIKIPLNQEISKIKKRP
jgi:hypothetical protein